MSHQSSLYTGVIEEEPMSDEVGVPAAAELIRDFVNTREPQVDRESLSTPDELRRWFSERHLMPANAQLQSSDLAAAIAVREGLRALLLSHAGHSSDNSAVHALNQALAELPMRLTFTDTGYRLVSASETPFGHALGHLADAVRQSSEDGTWPRLKVCARDTCRWAFYDASRNQVRRWCSMAGCGNHIKMQRAYAARKNRKRQPPADRANAPGA
jgi:predicted RNA-binding Zn ribbon-like protein